MPENTTISVGENVAITCDSGSNITVPNLLINNQGTNNNPQVIDITPLGSPNQLRVFNFIFATRENNGIVFTCVNTAGSLILNVLCKLS